MWLSRASSLHKTGAAGVADMFAKFIRLTMRVSADPDLVEPTSPGGAKHYRLQIWIILIADDPAQPSHCTRIHCKRLIAIKASGNLNAPGLGDGTRHILFKLSDKTIGIACEQRDQLAAAGLWPSIRHLTIFAGRGPVVETKAGNRNDVIAGLLWHAARAGEPF